LEGRGDTKIGVGEAGPASGFHSLHVFDSEGKDSTREAFGKREFCCSSGGLMVWWKRGQEKRGSSGFFSHEGAFCRREVRAEEGNTCLVGD